MAHVWKYAALLSAIALAIVLSVITTSSESARQLLFDHRFWWLAAAMLGAVVWWDTGRPPWVWLALGLLHLEAARRQAIVSAVFAARHFVNGYLERYADVRSEVLINLTQGE